MRIVAHCLIKNEENFVWFAINSVLSEVDEVLVWDMDSADKTVEIVKLIDSKKIKFKETAIGDSKKVSELRQKMLDETDSDWVLILDGDEIWHQDAIVNCKLKIENSKYDLVVVPNYMLIGDIFHYQEKEAGRYRIGDKIGHFNIRLFRRKIEGLHLEGVYPLEAYVDSKGVKLQDFPKERILFFDEPYLHASFLPRSRAYTKKIKYEIGEEFPRDFYYPEVFFNPRPSFVPSPWKPMSKSYKLRAFFETPLKKLKRRVLP